MQLGEKESKFVRMAEVLPRNEKTAKLLKIREEEAETKRAQKAAVSYRFI